MPHSYEPETITREDVDALPGTVVLQFGTNWCGYCSAAAGAIDGAVEPTGVRRILIEDGKGRPLGRSFHVKLWPTVIVLQDGVEVARVVRPWKAEDLDPVVASLSPADGEQAPSALHADR